MPQRKLQALYSRSVAALQGEFSPMVAAEREGSVAYAEYSSPRGAGRSPPRRRRRSPAGSGNLSGSPRQLGGARRAASRARKPPLDHSWRQPPARDAPPALPLGARSPSPRGGRSARSDDLRPWGDGDSVGSDASSIGEYTRNPPLRVLSAGFV